MEKGLYKGISFWNRLFVDWFIYGKGLLAMGFLYGKGSMLFVTEFPFGTGSSQSGFFMEKASV